MSSASDFEISEGRLPGLRTVVVEGHGVRCEIAHRGATVLSWRSGHDDIIDGYHDATELGGQDGVRSGILVPFAGRIRDAAYTWNELRHDLRPGSSDRDVFHGVLRESYFELVGVTREPEAARMRFRAVTSRSRHAGYPFPLCSDVDYVVRREGIDVSVSVVNTGESPAPITLGWHPYFRLPSARSVDAITLRVNASSVLVTDAQLLPVHGETRDVTGTSLDFREARIIGTDMIDLTVAKELSIVVSNQPGRTAPVVAEHMFGLLFTVAKRAAFQTAEVRAHKWTRYMNLGVQDKVLGIVGTGNIGAEMVNALPPEATWS